MVTSIIQIASLAVISVALCKLMDKYDRIYGLMIGAAASVLIILAVFAFVSPIIQTVDRLFSASAIDNQYVEILFKALGVCYIIQFACDICRDGGENTLAAQLEFAGKVCLLTLALPLFQKLSEIVMKFMSL
ncbi:MAG: hypothetical protein JG769_44 [Oscillospiraceae bacterium]|jgi:stage III sporulation protein AD|nr:hypothetical protein [Oscillospiraceae bacterium]